MCSARSTADERRAAEARIAADPAFAAAVAAWQKRLQPLADAEPPVAPPPHLWARIEAGIGRTSRAGGGDQRRRAAPFGPALAADRRRVCRRRGRAGGGRCRRPAPASAAVRVRGGADRARRHHAGLRRHRRHRDSRTIQLVRVATPAPPDKSYELWSILPDQAPHSLGVIEKANYRRAIDTAPAPDVTLAVTLEQKGGSPTGAPQGPLVFNGTLLPAQ